MAPMQIANAGMNMSGPTNMDMPPEGQRRLNVEFFPARRIGRRPSYSSETSGSGEGMKETGPYQSKLGTGTVPAGSAVSGSMTFQVPEEASKLMLGFGDGGRKVALIWAVCQRATVIWTALGTRAATMNKGVSPLIANKPHRALLRHTE